VPPAALSVFIRNELYQDFITLAQSMSINHISSDTMLGRWDSEIVSNLGV
jgi:hypothetical protein